MTTTRFLVNPSSGGGRAGRSVEKLRRLAGGRGKEVHVSRDAEDLVSYAKRAVEDGVERLVVGGGDGTFHLVVQALASSKCALGLIPLGRGNDLAGAAGIPSRLEDAFEIALEGRVASIDLGQVGEKYFASYCGVGFDSEVGCYVNSPGRWLKGRLAYVFGVLRTLASFRPPFMTVGFDGGDFEGRAMFVTVANGSRFGGGMKIAPLASLTDGLLDLVVVRQVGRIELLKVFPQVYRGTHVDHPAIQFHRTRQANIALDRPMELFGDGEAMTTVQAAGVTAKVRPAALKIVAAG